MNNKPKNDRNNNSRRSNHSDNKLKTKVEKASGIGMNYFKSMFENTRSQNKVQRLSSMVQIVKKSKKTLMGDKSGLLTKLKSEIKNTKSERKERIKNLVSEQQNNSKKDIFDAIGMLRSYNHLAVNLQPHRKR